MLLREECVGFWFLVCFLVFRQGTLGGFFLFNTFYTSECAIWTNPSTVPVIITTFTYVLHFCPSILDYK